jgi:hypothetical protein
MKEGCKAKEKGDGLPGWIMEEKIRRRKGLGKEAIKRHA